VVEITFLTLGEVVAIHQDQIRRYGGSPGIHDWGLLKSAVAMPAAMFGGQFLHSHITEMAAAYLFHLVANHPFIDGNKRVGAVAADIFLALNGWQLTADEDAYADLVLSVAASKSGKPLVAEFIRQNASQL
jgi:death-on-curing protein